MSISTFIPEVASDEAVVTLIRKDQEDRAYRINERLEVRRERNRLIKMGRIKFENFMKPTKIIKIDGEWKIQIG